jgi:hypothetical protein
MTADREQEARELARSLHALHPSTCSLPQAQEAAVQESLDHEEDFSAWAARVRAVYESHCAQWAAERTAKANAYVPPLHLWFREKMYLQTEAGKRAAGGKRNGNVRAIEGGEKPAAQPIEQAAFAWPEPKPERPSLLTNEVRAELVALTGHDLSPDDPALVLVVLNQILLPRLAADIAEIFRGANVEAVEQLAHMRRETVQSVAAELLVLASQTRDSLRIDLSEASGRASQIVQGIETAITTHRAFWAAAGFVACALLALGIVIGTAMRG